MISEWFCIVLRRWTKKHLKPSKTQIVIWERTYTKKIPKDFPLILARKKSLTLLLWIENSSNHISRLCTHVTFTVFVSVWHLPWGLRRNYHDCCITSSCLRSSWHKVIQGNSLSLSKTFFAFFSCKKLFDTFTITSLFHSTCQVHN